MKKMQFTLVSLCLSLTLTLAGCASTTDGRFQSIFLQTVHENEVIEGVGCTLSNEHGNWNLSSSSTRKIQRGYGPLHIKCSSKDGLYYADEKVESTANSSIWANVFLGGIGGIGAIADSASASAYDYPSNVLIVLRKRNLNEGVNK